MKMNLLANLFILSGLVLVFIGVMGKFFSAFSIFPDISMIAHITFANTCFLIALILKLAND